MFPSQWVLRAVAIFPATRAVLETLAERHGAKSGQAVVDGLLSEGRLVMLGERRAARYCLPQNAPRNRKRARRGQ